MAVCYLSSTGMYDAYTMYTSTADKETPDCNTPGQLHCNLLNVSAMLMKVPW